MKKLETTLTGHLVGFVQEKVDLNKYETSFHRWLVCEIESGRMSWQEARSRFNLPYRFKNIYSVWQKRYSDQIILTLPLMSAEDRTNNQKLEKRVRELEKQLELAQMKVVALNTVIDIAEKTISWKSEKNLVPSSYFREGHLLHYFLASQYLFNPLQSYYQFLRVYFKALQYKRQKLKVKS